MASMTLREKLCVACVRYELKAGGLALPPGIDFDHPAAVAQAVESYGALVDAMLDVIGEEMRR
jgi:hypothetical protein